jgi:hypothetical protein
MKDLSVIIAHFDKYPLLTQKLANEGAARAYVLFFSFKRKMRRGEKSPAQNFLLFKRVIELMNRKEHLTTGGLRKIVGIKAGAKAPRAAPTFQPPASETIFFLSWI